MYLGMVWHRKLCMKSWYNSNNLCKYCRYFVCGFLCQIVLLPLDKNFTIPSNQNLSILLVSNMYDWNIGTFWHKRLCSKTWYSSKPLWILLIFLVCFFESKISWYPQLTYCDPFIKSRKNSYHFNIFKRPCVNYNICLKVKASFLSTLD